MKPTTFDDSQKQFEQPFEQSSETEAPEDTKTAIGRLREEIRALTVELEMNEATLATVKGILSGTN
jgi:hypothetical protein